MNGCGGYLAIEHNDVLNSTCLVISDIRNHHTYHLHVAGTLTMAVTMYMCTNCRYHVADEVSTYRYIEMYWISLPVESQCQ